MRLDLGNDEGIVLDSWKLDGSTSYHSLITEVSEAVKQAERKSCVLKEIPGMDKETIPYNHSGCRSFDSCPTSCPDYTPQVTLKARA